jgi:hypothetical protein
MTATALANLSVVADSPEEVTFGERQYKRRHGTEDAYITRNGTAGNVVLCIRKGLVNEVFPGETLFDFNRGLHPNEAWIRITPNKKGVKMVGALYFSIGSIIPRERVDLKERRSVELHKRDKALFVKLPWELIK